MAGLVASVLQIVDVIVKTRDFVVGFHDAPEEFEKLLSRMNEIMGRLTMKLETTSAVAKTYKRVVWPL
jgi:hypothetical protein